MLNLYLLCLLIFILGAFLTPMSRDIIAVLLILLALLFLIVLPVVLIGLPILLVCIPCVLIYSLVKLMRR